MFKLFRYWDFFKRAGGAMLHPGSRAAAQPVKCLIVEAKSDVASFLERVYLNQRC